MYVDNEETIRFGQLFRSKCRRRYVREHDTIKKAIGAHLQSLGYEVVYEWRDVDEDSSYRYDIIAQKKKALWVVEVKPFIDKKDFGQIQAYINQVKKENPEAKIWLGTDCLQFDELIQGEMTKEWMEEDSMGIILINPELIWILPKHKDLLDVQERGHLCEDCGYCDGFRMNNIARKILVAIEEGCKKTPRFTQTDADTEYELSSANFKDIKKEMIAIKKNIGAKSFEEKTGLKIEKG
jgi:hypothetical protein